MIDGGCLCGQVRYHSDQDELGQAVCHCTSCQRQAGTAFSVLIAVRASATEIKGETKIYEDRADSGAQVNRHFCPNCGSPIFTALPAQPKLLFIKAGTLDDAKTRLSPKTHVWCDSAWDWTPIPEDAVRIAKNS